MYDDVNNILYHKFGVTVLGTGNNSFSLVSAAVSPELLVKVCHIPSFQCYPSSLRHGQLERRSRVVYLCGIAANEVEELGVRLGRGAFGTVQKVVHKPTNRVLAIKVVPNLFL